MSDVAPPSDLAPPKALLELARRHTRGEASPRRHQASRAVVIDRLGHRRTSPWTAFAVVGLVVGGGAAAFAGVRELRIHQESSSESLPTIIATTSATARPRQARPTPVNELGVQITVQPENAVIYWDDKRLEDNPATQLIAADHKPHRIRAEAPGYQTKTQVIVLDDDYVRMEIDLKPLPMTLGPITSTASINDADTVVEALRDAFQACYAEALSVTPNVAGKATLVLHVEAGGDVESSEIVEREGLTAKMTQCMQSSVEGVELHTLGKPGSVRIPMQFKAK